jgi:peptidoglycan hydrolase-like protein with peptidoglycan-binding domain
MGLFYTATTSTGVQAIAAAGDMLELLAPADAAVIIHRMWIEQSSEAGDTASEGLTVHLRRVTGAPTSGSGGPTPTPTPMISGAPAAGSGVELNNTTDLTGGTNTVILARAFNVMNGLEVVFTPEERPEIAPSTRFLVTLEKSPADSVDFDYGIVFEEVGG